MRTGRDRVTSISCGIRESANEGSREWRKPSFAVISWGSDGSKDREDAVVVAIKGTRVQARVDEELVDARIQPVA